MGRFEKTLSRVLRGTADANIAFSDLCALLRHLGFDERVRGGHHIFTREGVAEILNLQPRGNQAKPYQVKQVRGVIVTNGLADDAEEWASETTDEYQTEGQRRRSDMPDRVVQYEIVLYWSKEDQAFIAEVPELPGCAADGATYQDALANVEVVIREWIETARELGRPIPQPRGRLMYA